MTSKEKDENRLMLPHDLLELHSTQSNFYFVPKDASLSSSSLKSVDVLVVDRVSREVSLQRNDGQLIPGDAEVQLIHGIFGIIRLLAGPYLIVITKKELVKEITDKTVWRITGTQVLPYQKTLLHLNDLQVQDNAKYLSMVESVLNMEHFYFSTTYDLTHTMQRLYNTSPDFKHMPLHERADQRFVWNGFILRELSQQSELSRFCIPIMLGFIRVNDVCVRGKTFKYTLVSRRSCFRAGTRYYMRGIDSEGNAANFVETEQIVEVESAKSSFVQTRGSVPLYWQQYPNLKYKPLAVLSTTQNHLDGFQRHFSAQEFHYGKQVLVNLLDQKGHEQKLVDNFCQTSKNANDAMIRYEPFDFHKECSKMRWHRLVLLTDRLAEDQKKFGYFMIRDTSLQSQQSGIFRTNCIDCLDRTNVVQSMFASKSLQDQFVKLGLLSSGEEFENLQDFDRIFKDTWADNADFLAKQYAGTGALKTDFTRTGKRTTWGLIRDGINSAVRYVLNNFFDGFRQDSVDLFLGNYEVDENEGTAGKPSPLRLERDWKFYALPTVFIVAFSMLVVSVIIPDEHLSEQIMYVLFWGGASAITLAAIYYFGNVFVDRPKLVQAKLKTE